MKLNRLSRLIPSIALLAVLILVGRVVSAETTTTLSVGVGCDYSTIQEAVDAASNGDTINVSAALFNGSDATFDITDKSLTIAGGYQFCSVPSRLPTILNGLLLNGPIVEIGGATTHRQVTLRNLDITGGTNISFAAGGGISIKDNFVVTLSNLTIRENNAYHGAGVSIEGDSTLVGGSSLIISNSVFVNNIADSRGGGIYATGGSIVDVNGADVLFSNNSAAQSGGGINISDNSRLEFDGGKLFNNRSQNLTGGGGVYAGGQGTTFLIENTEIISNSAANGGGLMAQHGASGTIRGNSVISGNEAIYEYSGGESGGGIYAFGPGSVITISDNTTIEGNSALIGGGVGLQGAKVVMLDSAEIISNTAQTGGGVSLRYSTLLAEGAQNSRPRLSENASIGLGGAIYAKSSSIISLNMVDLISNTAGTGGGLYAVSSTAFLTNTHLVGNNQYTVYLNSSEGTIAAEFKSALQPLGCDPALLPDGRYCSHFDQNLGSAISVGSGSNLKLSHTAITRNSGTHPARDVTVNLSGFDATATFDTVLLVHNEDDVSIGIGGNNNAETTTAIIRNSTIISNTGTPLSTDEQSVVTIQRNVIWGNESGSQIETQSAFSSECNIVQAIYPGTAAFTGQGDISANPMLTNEGQLTWGSPAIDACEVVGGETQGSGGFDIVGRSRWQDGNYEENVGEYDMGAFEFDPMAIPTAVDLKGGSAESNTINPYALTAGLLLVTFVTWGVRRSRDYSSRLRP